MTTTLSEQELEQHFGHASGAAARVQDGLVAGELQAVDHRGPPAELRVGDPVVRRGVPVSRHAGTIDVRRGPFGGSVTFIT